MKDGEGCDDYSWADHGYLYCPMLFGGSRVVGLVGQCIRMRR